MNRLKQIFSKKQKEPMGSTKENYHLPLEHSHTKDGYQCPMKCEGKKIYEAPGNCPVCNMNLVPLNEIKRNSHH
jgi:Heavy metal binding domain